MLFRSFINQIYAFFLKNATVVCIFFANYCWRGVRGNRGYRENRENRDSYLNSLNSLNSLKNNPQPKKSNRKMKCNANEVGECAAYLSYVSNSPTRARKQFASYLIFYFSRGRQEEYLPQPPNLLHPLH